MKRFLILAVVTAVSAVGCSDGSESHGSPMAPELGEVTAAYSTQGETGAATVSTDKDDYAPGETVVITGTGWLPGETVRMELHEDPHIHGVVVLSSVADASGGFVNTEFAPDEHDVGVTFTLVATGLTSGQTATATFTDGNVSAGPIDTYEPAISCSVLKDSFVLGQTVCARTTITVTGAGGGDFRIQWVGPAPATTVVRETLFSDKANNSTHQDTFTPASTGNWTVRTCRGATGTCSGGTILDSEPFTVAAAPVDNTPPVITMESATPTPTNGSAPVTLTARATDSQSNVASATYNIDGGSYVGNAMSALDGAFDEKEEDLTATIAAATILGLTEGTHTFCIKAKDTQNNESAGTNPDDCVSIVVDKTPPTVTIDQAVGQADPTKLSPINFTVLFSESVSDFATGDVTLGGSASATSATVTGSGTTYNVAVSGMTGDGSVIASVAAGVAHDAAGNASQASTSTDNQVIYDTTPPMISSVTATPNPTNGSAAVTLTASATDALSTVVSADYRIGTGTWTSMDAQDAGFDELSEDLTATIAAAVVAALAEGSHSLCVRASDLATNTSDGTSCTTLVVDKTPPEVTNVEAMPNPARYDEAVMLGATATDALTYVAGAMYSLDGGVWTAMTAEDGTWDELVEVVKATLAAFGGAGVHDLCVRATDAAGNSSDGSACTLLAVYDPSAGFVTGGGWITSPLGAYMANPALTGKATFGFVAKYKKGAQTPEGSTEFQFHAAGMNFHSNTYDWLVVAGARAQYKGYGTVNGVAGYRFLLTAIDGQVNGGGGVDRMRMKIIHVATGNVVYDNQPGAADSGDASTALGGGSIIVHTGKK